MNEQKNTDHKKDEKTTHESPMNENTHRTDEKPTQKPTPTESKK